jgi:hypothetical protein
VERRSTQSPVIDPWILGLALIGAIAPWRLLMAGLVPVTGDEARHFDWACTLALPLMDAHQRFLRETHGLRDLAEPSARLDGPIDGDRYQDVAMPRFYQPAISATQWPGLSRPSEYLRGRIAPKIDLRAWTASLGCSPVGGRL